MANIETPSQEIIRGYNQSLITRATWRNVDNRLIVSPLPGDSRVNFKVSVFFSDVDRRIKRTGKVEDYLNTTYLNSHLHLNDTLSIDYTLDLFVRRDNCPKFNFLCASVLPGNQSSYEEYDGQLHYSCTNLTNILNCIGLKIENLTFLTIPNSLPENTEASFNVRWDKGTDVNFTLNFDDGKVENWNWFLKDHVQSYLAIDTLTFTNLYEHYGVYNVTLKAWNEAGIEILWLQKKVEPILKNHIHYKTSYVPNEPPLKVSATINYINETNNQTRDIYLTCFIDSGHNFSVSKAGILNFTTPFSIEYFYTKDLDAAVAIVTCNNSVSSITGSITFLLQQNITGLNISYEKLIWPSFKNISLTLSLQNGSDVEYDIFFGDGSNITLKSPTIFAYEEPLIIQHTYKIAGVFQTYVLARNTFFNVSSITEYSVMIQHRINNATASLTYNEPRNVSLLLKQYYPYHQPTNVTCQAFFGNDTQVNNTFTDFLAGTQINHVFDERYSERAFRYVTVECNCSNLVSAEYFLLKLSLREKITELNFSSNLNVSRINNNVQFKASTLTGDDVTLYLDFGDGSMTIFPNGNIYIPTLFNHSYSVANNYTVTLTINNTVNELTDTLALPIVIQNPINDLSIIGVNVTTFDVQPVEFTINVNKASLPPNDVFCWLQTPSNFTLENYQYLPDLSTAKSVKIHHRFERRDAGQILTVVVTCKNLVSSVSDQYNISVYEKIKELHLSYNHSSEKSKNFTTRLTVKNGSSITYSISYSNFSTIFVKHPQIYASDEHLDVNYQFPEVGIFKFKVVAENFVSKQEYFGEVIIEHSLINVTLQSNDSILWTPGVIVYKLFSENNQEILTNVNCSFNFSNGMTKNEKITEWKTSQSIYYAYVFPKSAIGLLNATVTCNNLISSITLNTSTNIIFDEVLIESITSNGTVFLTNVSTIITEVKRMGTNSCFIFEMGDDKSTKYGYGVNDICRDYTDSQSIPFTKISYDKKTIVVEHIYDKFADFTVTVKGFNHLTEVRAQTVAKVMEWLCFIPNATIPDTFMNKGKPLQLPKGLSTEIPVNITQNCMKTTTVVYDWKAYNLLSNQLVYTYTNKSFTFPPRRLDFGLYRVDYNIHMLNLKNLASSYEIYIEVVSSPLQVILVNGKKTIAEYNSIFTLDAFKLSHDPDNFPHERLKGMSFFFYCREVNEKQTFTSKFTDENPKNIPTLEEFRKNGGCFGRGPGQLKQDSMGIRKINTQYMLPNKTYIVSIRATSIYENRETIFEHEIEIPAPDPPNLKLTCLQNCDYKKGLSLDFINKVQCLSGCKGMYWSISYLWRLYEQQDDGEYKEVNDLSSVITDNVTADTINIKKGLMTHGKEHILIIEGVLKGASEVGLRNSSFIVNKPPYGGICDCNPKSGYAGETSFAISCINWKEFDRTPEQMKLNFKYRARPEGEKLKFLLHFSLKQETVFLMLPVGGKKNRTTDLIIDVIDSVGDVYEYIINIKVLPPGNPIDETFERFDSVLNNDSLEKDLINGSFSQVSAVVFSITSILNADLNDTDAASLTEAQKLERQCNQTKSRMKVFFLHKLKNYPNL